MTYALYTNKKILELENCYGIREHWDLLLKGRIYLQSSAVFFVLKACDHYLFTTHIEILYLKALNKICLIVSYHCGCL